MVTKWKSGKLHTFSTTYCGYPLHSQGRVWQRFSSRFDVAPRMGETRSGDVQSFRTVALDHERFLNS